MLFDSSANVDLHILRDVVSLKTKEKTLSSKSYDTPFIMAVTPAKIVIFEGTQTESQIAACIDQHRNNNFLFIIQVADIRSKLPSQRLHFPFLEGFA